MQSGGVSPVWVRYTMTDSKEGGCEGVRDLRATLATLIIGGSYRQLSEFGLRKSAGPRRREDELRGDEPRVVAADKHQASSKQRQAAV